ncbi:hypothetical protein BGW39_008114 [Mortierella sp. 14UC]|nr:hypothetical protein BGW39_008114 [Mortierella sp. 14UC]
MPESRPPITNSPSIPAILLAECSHKMRKVQIPRSNLPSQQQQQQEQGVGNDDEKEEGEPLAGLKVLEVSPFNDDGNWSSWKRLLKRCVYLETLHLPAGVESGWSQALAECTSLKRLKVVCIDRPEVRLLTKILRNSGGDSSGLSNLDDIELDYLEQEAVNVTGEDITALLLANRKGWRNIGLSSLRTEQSVEALIHHCATLELLRVNEAPGLTSAHMHHILSSSPRLHTFTTLADGEYPYPEVAYFLPEDFIDLDPITNTLRPWSCESTLRRFCAKIEHIPRPDVTLTHYGLPRTEPEEGIVVEVLQETRTGQSHELQARIYERLARFTQLESLALGHDDRDFGNESLFIIGPDGDPTFGDQHFQYDCLSFSLDSGLQALEALRGLKKLNVFRMATAIGVEEVQWMSRVWPKLESLIGLNPEEAKENDALAWLRENCPRIKLEPFAPWP